MHKIHPYSFNSILGTLFPLRHMEIFGLFIAFSWLSFLFLFIVNWWRFYCFHAFTLQICVFTNEVRCTTFFFIQFSVDIFLCKWVMVLVSSLSTFCRNLCFHDFISITSFPGCLMVRRPILCWYDHFELLLCSVYATRYFIYAVLLSWHPFYPHSIQFACYSVSLTRL